MSMIHRRRFLSTTAAAGCAATATWVGAATPKPRPRVAAIFTVLRFRSHAYNILENFLGPYYFNGQITDPGVDIVSFYADQFPADDMAREAAARFKIPLCKTIDEAMCVGGKSLDVDAVLLIGEHGDYPYNERGQHLYPRKRFFDEAVAVMRRADRFLPVFNDKHLSYRWDWAKEMYDTARRHKMPLLAGSSVPLAQRRPTLELPQGAVIEEAVAIHGGGLESYDFHGLEVLQSQVESRRGGETGITKIELLHGDTYQQAMKAGRWSRQLVEAAMTAERKLQPAEGKLRQTWPRKGVFRPPQPERKLPPRPEGDYAICLHYKDGLKATVLKQGSSADRWNFACQLQGESGPRATAYFNGPWGNRGLFKALSHAIQHLFIHGEEPYPAERTLLTTGAVEAAVHAFNSGHLIATPHLEFAYQGVPWKQHREMGPTWKKITVDTKQPMDFLPRLGLRGKSVE